MMQNRKEDMDLLHTGSQLKKGRFLSVIQAIPS